MAKVGERATGTAHSTLRLLFLFARATHSNIRRYREVLPIQRVARFTRSTGIGAFYGLHSKLLDHPQRSYVRGIYSGYCALQVRLLEGVTQASPRRFGSETPPPHPRCQLVSELHLFHALQQGETAKTDQPFGVARRMPKRPGPVRRTYARSARRPPRSSPPIPALRPRGSGVPMARSRYDAGRPRRTS